MGFVSLKYDFSFKSLMNAETEEEVDMIRTDNPGVLAAIREVKLMNLGRGIRTLYEAHMKEVRDREAREEYVRDEGKAEKLISIVRKMSAKDMPVKTIADILGEDAELVGKIEHLLRRHPDWEDSRIYRELQKDS